MCGKGLLCSLPRRLRDRRSNHVELQALRDTCPILYPLYPYPTFRAQAPDLRARPGLETSPRARAAVSRADVLYLRLLLGATVGAAAPRCEKLRAYGPRQRNLAGPG